MDVRYIAQRMRLEDRLVNLGFALFLVFVAIITFYPFGHTLAVSFNDSIDTIRGGLTVIPRDFTTAAYGRLLRNMTLYRAAGISVLRTSVGVLLSTTATIMVAYALSRREFMLRRLISFMIIVTMYVSGGLIPQYFLYRSLKLLNNFWVYILPSLATAFNIIIVRTYIRQQPDSFVESAKIDGAGDFRIIFSIVMPIILPVIAVVVLFVAVHHWNSWIDTYIFASRNDALSTLQFELQKRIQSAMSMVTQVGETSQEALADAENALVLPEAVRAAMTMITVVPIVLVYPFVQRYFVTGLIVGGLKG